MASSKQAHGATLQQALILGILGKHGSLSSSEIAAHFAELTKIPVAYNYQYIVTRRMADQGMIKPKDGSDSKSGVFQWTLTAAGRKRLAEVRKLAGIVSSMQ